MARCLAETPHCLAETQRRRFPLLRCRRTGQFLEHNVPFRVEGPLFRGEIIIATSGLRAGCLASITVSGTFLQTLDCEQCYTGQAFDTPLPLPSSNSVVSRMGLALLHAWSPCLHVSTGAKPHMLTPIMAVASRVIARSRGESPDVYPPDNAHSPLRRTKCGVNDAPDDDALGPFAEQRLEGTRAVCGGHRARRRFFARGSSSYTFSPAHIYAFHFVVRRLDLATMRLVGLPAPLNVRLDEYLAGQPLRLMCAWHAEHPGVSGWSIDDAVPLWDIEVWSEHLWNVRAAGLGVDAKGTCERPD